MPGPTSEISINSTANCAGRRSGSCNRDDRTPLGNTSPEPRPMSSDAVTTPLVLSTSELEELGHLDYLLRRLEDLLGRGLIPPESYATVAAESRGRREAIERQGQFQAAWLQAE